MSRSGRRAEFLEILGDQSELGNRRWRQLAAELLANAPSAGVLCELFQAIKDYDAVFGDWIGKPVPVPPGAVVVSGSGKEPFKTFNVSTTASIVAATAGVPVIKGVSRSVSAVSGARDILDCLGVEVVTEATALRPALDRHGIVFVDFSTFCPRFFARYDGSFTELSPTGLFMPIAGLCVEASCFVHGLAATFSHAAAEAISRCCPWVEGGVVVGAEPACGRIIDEYVRRGRFWRSDVDGRRVTTRVATSDPVGGKWLEAVAHRYSHGANADFLRAVLAGEAPGAANDLVYDNAALVIEMSRQVPYDEARARAVEAHTSGRAAQLLRQLITGETAVRAA